MSGAISDEKKGESPPPAGSIVSSDGASDFNNSDALHRRLNNRHIQLIAIGGSIGTAMFISIGGGLAVGGPGSLLISYTLYSCVLALVNNCITEMTTLMPVSGGFIRLAGLWVDDALGFMAGWNFFFYEALLIPFEITALNMVLSFWNSDVTNPGPTAAVCAACIVAYGSPCRVASGFDTVRPGPDKENNAERGGEKDSLPPDLNFPPREKKSIRGYGEAEFWLSGGKVILIFMLFGFTFVTMVGGNPQHDAYGFRYWREPGAFAEHHSTGALGRFEGFLGALWTGCFAIVGPEYISMVAAEAKRPRIYVKQAFKTVYWRFGIFFILGALCVGIVVPYNDPTLKGILDGTVEGSGTAAASPYVIAMKNMNIKILPHVTNFLMFTSIFSAGNTYTYCAIRSLYSLALEGRAPKFLTKVTKSGVPIYCYFVVMLFPFLSFLQVSNSSATVLTWLVSLVTAGGLIDYIVMTVTYIFFYRACVAQGVDRKTFPYCGWFQPYSAWIALVAEVTVTLCYGYSSFQPPNVETFFQNYTMVVLAPILFIGWKVVKKTKFIKPHEADLVYQRPAIDAYEAAIKTPPVSFWTEMVQLVGFRRRKVKDREQVDE
ncbi:hypothetical protein jhhlp_008292 [Lomentospora prolificans]|uniref:Amino acid permease/ SLC12A domain-containing protein n=1 Tax=Lomentospora prolificans TaxID=41688 RepID=A0A2N3MXM5_9PEZI|nr:hypothetical protein jhhlp_008292 [Lomentospora prolificans]